MSHSMMTRFDPAVGGAVPWFGAAIFTPPRASTLFPIAPVWASMVMNFPGSSTHQSLHQPLARIRPSAQNPGGDGGGGGGGGGAAVRVAVTSITDGEPCTGFPWKRPSTTICMFRVVV